MVDQSIRTKVGQQLYRINDELPESQHLELEWSRELESGDVYCLRTFATDEDFTPWMSIEELHRYLSGVIDFFVDPRLHFRPQRPLL
jgi:hypothetical protein